METLNKLSRTFYCPSAGLLLLRFVVGAAFFEYGWGKLMNDGKIMGLVAHLGWAPFMAYFIMWLEIIGGLMLIFGVLTRAAAVVMAVEILVALVLVALPMKGFMGSNVEWLLLFGSLAIALTGAGKYRLTSVFEESHKKDGEAHTAEPATV